MPGQVINEVYNPGLDTQPYAEWLETALQSSKDSSRTLTGPEPRRFANSLTGVFSSHPAWPTHGRGGSGVHARPATSDCRRGRCDSLAAGLPGGHKPFIECPEQFGDAVRVWVIAHAEPRRGLSRVPRTVALGSSVAIMIRGRRSPHTSG